MAKTRKASATNTPPATMPKTSKSKKAKSSKAETMLASDRSPSPVDTGPLEQLGSDVEAPNLLGEATDPSPPVRTSYEVEQVETTVVTAETLTQMAGQKRVSTSVELSLVKKSKREPSEGGSSPSSEREKTTVILSTAQSHEDQLDPTDTGDEEEQDVVLTASTPGSRRSLTRNQKGKARMVHTLKQAMDEVRTQSLAMPKTVDLGALEVLGLKEEVKAKFAAIG